MNCLCRTILNLGNFCALQHTGLATQSRHIAAHQWLLVLALSLRVFKPHPISCDHVTEQCESPYPSEFTECTPDKKQAPCIPKLSCLLSTPDTLNLYGPETLVYPETDQTPDWQASKVHSNMSGDQNIRRRIQYS